MDKDKLNGFVEKVSKMAFHEFIDFRVDSIGNGKCVLYFPSSKNTLNAYGFIHGGIYYTVLDVAAFLATVSKLDDGQVPVTANINISVMKAVSQGDLRVEAEILKLGKRNCFLESKAFDRDGDLVATALITKVILPKSNSK